VKKLSATGEDVAGRYQLDTDGKLRRLQEKYGLMNIPLWSSERFRGEAERMFQSQRARMLWMRARETEFEEEAMEILKRELEELDAHTMDHEDKMKELSDLIQVKEEIHKRGSRDRISDDELKKINRERKNSHHQLRKQYSQLQERVDDGTLMDEEFFNSKLDYLRQKVAEMDAPEEEMKAIQAHLDHFEGNLKRLELLKIKLAEEEEMNKDEKIKRGRNASPMTGSNRNEPKEKVGVAYKALRKLYKHLVTRIGKKDEL
jgi:DNA repair exonuclease SbcCD ATPase subunit